MLSYTSCGVDITVNLDDFQFMDIEVESCGFYFLVSNPNFDERGAFIKSVLSIGVPPEGNRSVLEAVLEVDSNGRIITQNDKALNPIQVRNPTSELSAKLESRSSSVTTRSRANLPGILPGVPEHVEALESVRSAHEKLSYYLQSQVGGTTKGGLWVRTAELPRQSIVVPDKISHERTETEMETKSGLEACPCPDVTVANSNSEMEPPAKRGPEEEARIIYETIESAGARIRNIASMYSMLKRGRNPPETFISLASRDVDLRHCRLASSISVGNTTAEFIIRILDTLQINESVVSPFATTGHMSTIVVTKVGKNEFTINHIDSLKIQNKSSLERIIKGIGNSVTIKIENYGGLGSQNPKINSCTYHSEANAYLVASYLSKTMGSSEGLLNYIDSLEYKKLLTDMVLSTLSCNPDYAVSKGLQDTAIKNLKKIPLRKEILRLIGQEDKIMIFTVGEIMDENFLKGIHKTLPKNGVNPECGRLVRVTTNDCFMSEALGLAGDLQLSQQSLQDIVSPDNQLPPNPDPQPQLVVPPSPIISKPSITFDPELRTTTISFKTNNTHIFRDIEEIRITLPRGIEVNQEYIDGLHQAITQQGFKNDHISLDCVRVKRFGRNVYEKMGEHTNKCIISRYMGGRVGEGTERLG